MYFKNSIVPLLIYMYAYSNCILEDRIQHTEIKM